MQIYRIYIPGILSIGLTIVLDKENANYITNVIRCKNGHIIRIFNSEHGEFEGILKLEKKSASIEITKLILNPEKNNKKLKLFFCPIKHHNMHIMIEKSVELGVTDLYPIISSNTIVREFNVEKYLKIIIQSVEQCERLDIPEIHDIMTLYDMANYISSSDDRILFACERSSGEISNRPLSKFASAKEIKGETERKTAVYKDVHEDLSTVSTYNLPVEVEFRNRSNEQFDGIIIGPEGGFKEEEVSLLKSIKNISEISLGKNILRAETAAISGLTIINFKRRNGY